MCACLLGALPLGVGVPYAAYICMSISFHACVQQLSINSMRTTATQVHETPTESFTRQDSVHGRPQNAASRTAPHKALTLRPSSWASPS